MIILPFQRLGLRSMPDSRTVTNCFKPPARFRRTLRLLAHRIALHETGAACGFGLAARHFVAVACDCLARRRSYAACWIAMRGGDILCRQALILLSNFKFICLYPRRGLQSSKEKKKIFLGFFLFIFFFLLGKSGPGQPPRPPPEGGGGTVDSESLRVPNAGQNSGRWDPQLGKHQ